MKSIIVFECIAILLGLFSTFLPPAQCQSLPVLASAGPIEITEEDLTRLVESVPSERPQKKNLDHAAYWARSLSERYIAGKLLLDQGIPKGEDLNITGIRGKIEMLVLNEHFADTYNSDLAALSGTSREEVSQQDVEDYYNSHSDRYRIPALIRFRHIFFYPGQTPSEEDWSKALDRANQAYEKLQSATDFTAVAIQHDELPVPVSEKGRLVIRQRGALSSELENQILKGEKGKALPPFKTRYGYEIFMLEDSLPEKVQSLEEVQSAIMQILEASETIRLQNLVTEKLEAIPVEYHPEVFDSTSNQLDAPVLRAGPYTMTWSDYMRSFTFDNQDNRTIQVLASSATRFEWLRNRGAEFQRAIFMTQLGLLDKPGVKEQIKTRQNWSVGDYLLHLKASELIPSKPSQKELREFYDTHPDVFALPDSWNGQGIIFSTGLSPDATEAEFGHAMQRMFPEVQDALRRARAGEDFAELAREYSDAPSAAKGGFISADDADKPFAFEDQTRDLPEGAITDIILLSDRAGYAIYKKGAAVKNRRRPFADCDACGLSMEALWRQQTIQELKATIAANLCKENGLKLDEAALLAWAIRQNTDVNRDGTFQPALSYHQEVEDASPVKRSLRIACHNLAPSDFRPAGTYDGVICSTTATWSTRETSTDLLAPIHVPEGSIIIAFGVSVGDANPDEPISGEVVIVDIHAPGGPDREDIRGTIATQPSDNMSGQRIHGMGLWIPADNQNETYQLRVRLPAGNESQKVFSALVFYLTREPEGKPIDEGILNRLTNPEHIRQCCGGLLPVGQQQ